MTSKQYKKFELFTQTLIEKEFEELTDVLKVYVDGRFDAHQRTLESILKSQENEERMLTDDRKDFNKWNDTIFPFIYKRVHRVWQLVDKQKAELINGVEEAMEGTLDKTITPAIENGISEFVESNLKQLKPKDRKKWLPFIRRG